MIPEFPNFKNLELSDIEEVRGFTSKYPPYSDFNFVSMYSWDTKREMQISILNNNLVVKFTDYINGQPFFSFLGEERVEDTARTLIGFSKKMYGKNLLRLVPEIVSSNMDDAKFNLLPDYAAHDYVYDVSHLANMHNWAQHTSGKHVRSFKKEFEGLYLVKHSPIKDVIKDEYLMMFRKWAENKDLNQFESLSEYLALKRAFQARFDNVHVVSLYIDGGLLGFTIYEKVSDEYAVSHFAKGDTKYHKAVNDILNWEEAKILHAQGIKYFNWEQDLGIPGLRKSKEKYNPVLYLKKHIVSNKTKRRKLFTNIRIFAIIKEWIGSQKSYSRS